MGPSVQWNTHSLLLGYFRLNFAQTAQAPGEVESYIGLQCYFEAETDFYVSALKIKILRATTPS